MTTMMMMMMVVVGEEVNRKSIPRKIILVDLPPFPIAGSTDASDETKARLGYAEGDTKWSVGGNQWWISVGW
jgi:hypothetical protein